ncbi:adenosine deaminase [Pigmentibacter sp. JX0631]|nr:adenosine deaminase [Pigmentibacter sp. JX0631]WGL59176.1 adenosine deaminase [Pigmentibacter sp. JX0631]
MLEELRKLPKAELHLHIEGTLEPELLFTLAKRNNILLPYKDIDELKDKYHFHDLQSFLDIYYNGTNVLITKQDFYDLTFAYLAKAKQDGIRHVEIFFDPQSHVSRGIEFKDVIEGISEALEQGKKEFGISYFIIMSFLRHLSQENALEVLEMALPYKDKIKAVGLDSSELGNPPSKFVELFKKCKENNFLTVAHAGEEGPASYIWEALNLLEIERIDHGIRCTEDPELLKTIIQKNIPLTVCPLSNIKLKVYQEMKEHNVKKLFDLGVKVTINSDDPAYFGGYLLENYIQCHNELGFTYKDMCDISKNSIEASFLSSADKLKLIKEIDSLNQKTIV